LLHLLTAAFVQVFGCRQWRTSPRALAAGGRKAPRHEIAGNGAAAVPQALWGFGHGVWLEEVGAERLW